jgi:hypothetical protein
MSMILYILTDTVSKRTNYNITYNVFEIIIGRRCNTPLFSRYYYCYEYF